MSEDVWRYLWGLIIEHNRGAGRLGLDRKSGDFPNRLELDPDLWSHASANIKILLDRFIAIQGDRELVRSEWDMSENVWRYLWGFIIEHNGGAGRLGLDRKSRDFLNRLKLDPDLWSHTSANI